MFVGSTTPDIHYIVKYNKSVNWKKLSCESNAFQGQEYSFEELVAEMS